jgi:hypothetical protein
MCPGIKTHMQPSQTAACASSLGTMEGSRILCKPLRVSCPGTVNNNQAARAGILGMPEAQVATEYCSSVF